VYVVMLGVKAPHSMEPAYVRQLESVFERVAFFYRVPLYPNILEGVSEDPDLNQADGYHPNGKGVDYIIENTYLMVDAGLRWKWSKLAEQSGFQEETKDALPPAMPPTAEPKDLPPVQRP
jgi:hypothetical protein